MRGKRMDHPSELVCDSNMSIHSCTLETGELLHDASSDRGSLVRPHSQFTRMNRHRYIRI